MPLPPVIQQFGIDASAYLAGIDEMLAATDRLAASMDAVLASADRMSASLSEASARADESLTAAAGAADEAAASAERATTAQVGLSDAEKAVADAAALEAEILGDLDRSQAMLADSAKAVTDGLAAEARAMQVVADSAAMAGDATAAAGAESGAAAAKMDASAGAAAGFGTAMKTALLGVGIAAVYGIDKAAGFQASMEQLHTQAGVAQSKIAGLSQGVLALAGQVGEGPDSLSESLYHVASNLASTGASGAQMLDAVKVAAEGAQVGNANLVDVTNALGAAIASGIPGVQNYTQAMGYMNATVGAGDMTMQNLSEAFGTGVLANIKMYGVTLQDVSAALATFGDNNIRGAKAGTDLRMSVQAMVAPVTTAAPALAQLGLKTTSFADAMKNGGLNSALELLVSHLKSAGVSSKDYGELITDIFGKKAGSGIGVLVGEFDRFQGKYADVKKGADEFASDWSARAQTMQQQWHDLVASAQALAISFGTVLLPAATKVIGALARFGALMEEHPAIAVFAGALLAVAVAFKVVAAAEAMFDAVTDADPVMLVVIAVIALTAALYELYEHSKLVRDVVADIGKFFAGAWDAAVRAAGAVVNWFVAGPLAFIRQEIAAFRAWWTSNSQEIEEVWRVAWDVISTVFRAQWALVKGEITTGLAVVKAIWKTGWDYVRDQFEVTWRIMADLIRFELSDIGSVISIFLDLLTGHWGKAWDSLKELPAKILSQVKTIVSDYVGGIAKTVSDLGKNLLGGFSGIWDSVSGSAKSGAKSAGHGAAGAFASGWDDVYRDTVGEVVRAFEGVKGAITSGFDGWWKTHGKGVEEAWRATWGALKPIFTALWGDLMANLKVAWAVVSTVTRVAWATVAVDVKMAWSVITAVFRIALAAIEAVVKSAWDVTVGVIRVGSALITAVVKTAWDVVSAVVKVSMAFVTAFIRTNWDVIVGIFSVALDLLTGHWAQAWADLQTTCVQVWHNITGFLNTAWSALSTLAGQVVRNMETYFVQAWNAISETTIQVWHNITGFVASAWHALVSLAMSLFSELVSFLASTWNSIYNGVVSAWNAVDAFFGGVPGRILAALGDLGGLLVGAGRAIIQGLINGVEDMAGQAMATIENVGHDIASAAKAVLGIFSPSKVFYAIGGQITSGLALGINETAAQAYAAAQNLAAKVTAAYAAKQITGPEESELLARINTDLAARNLSIQKTAASVNYDKLGADITLRLGAGMTETIPQAQAAARQLMKAVSQELSRGEISNADAEKLTNRIQAALSSRQERLVKTMTEIGLKMGAGMLSALANAASASAVKTAVDKLVSYVQTAWGAGDITTSRATALTTWLEADNTRLQTLAAQRQAIAATIKAADAYSGTTEANTISWAGLSNVTSSMTSGGVMYSGNILAGMQADLSSINQFTAAIKKLQNLGLSKDLLNQIIQMGPSQGLQVAQALINGPMSVIKSMNSTEAQIVSGSDSLGQAAANAMYDSGAAAGKGFLSGLAAQQKSITAVMDQIAESMVTTIKKDLKINSPSLVFDEQGQMVALGLQQGMQRGVTGVKGAARMLAGATALPGAGTGGAAGTGGSTTNHYHMQVTVTGGWIGNEQDLSKELYNVMQEQALQHKKRNGHNGFG